MPVAAAETAGPRGRDRGRPAPAGLITFAAQIQEEQPLTLDVQIKFTAPSQGVSLAPATATDFVEELLDDPPLPEGAVALQGIWPGAV